MARDSQSIICRRVTALKETNFKHNDLKYKQIGWNKSREEANKGIADPSISSTISADSSISNLTIYAVWKERDLLTRYQDLSISASNISYDTTAVDINYSITKIQQYEGVAVEKSREFITDQANDKFTDITENIDRNNLDVATSPRPIVVSYKHPESQLVAYTTITQSGYTPIFKIKCIDSTRGTIECWQNNVKLNCIEASNGVKIYASTNKNFTLKAVPKSLNTVKWVANKSCAYYSQPDKWILHSSTYPKNNSCGSWQVDNNIKYKLKNWEGGTITGSTSTTINVTGSVDAVPSFEAKFELLPLLQNVIVGDFRRTWQDIKIGKTGTCCFLSYREVHDFINACAINGWVVTGYNDTGRGWAPWWVSYAIRDIRHYTNIYNPVAVIPAPYTITIPEDGVLKIKGTAGIKVYGHICGEIFNINMFRFNELHRSFDNFKILAHGLQNSTVDYYHEINVKAGEKFQIQKATGNYNSLYIEKMELDTTPNIVAKEDPIVSYDTIIIDDMTNETKKAQLLDKYEQNNKTDYSVKVFEAKAGTRDRNSLPRHTMQFSLKQQSIVRIAVGGGHGWGYSQQLKIIDTQTNKVLKNIVATGKDWRYGVNGDLDTKVCYVYLPPSRKITINAVWTTVDTDHFDVWLDIKGVSFTEL